MKKFGFVTLVLLTLSCMNVSAKADVTADVDIANGKIVITGEGSSANETIAVQVFNGGKILADFEASVEQASSYAVYTGQGKTNDSGSYMFEFTYKGASDVLNGYIRHSAGDAPEHFTINFTGLSDYVSLIESLNSESDFESFYAICDNNKNALCPELSIMGDIDFKKAAKYFYDEVCKLKLDAEDSEKNTSRFMSCIAVQAFNEKKLSSVNAIADTLDLDKSLLEDIKSVSTDSNADKYFAELMCSKTIASGAELEDALTEAMILTAVKYPGGFAKLKALCEKYEDFIGLSKTYSSSAYKAIAGTKISTLKELKEKLNEAPSGSAGGGGGGGGGSSSGGSGSDSVGGSVMISGNISSGPSAVDEVYMPFEDLSPTNWAYEAVSVLADKKIVNGKAENLFYPNDYVTREEFAKMVVGALELELSNDNNGKFADVDKNEWYAPYIYTAYRNGVCEGISDNEFGIGRNIIRQDAAVMIYNAVGERAATVDAIEFSDSGSISDYAKNAVEKLSSMGVINGKGNNSFEPLSPLTRAEAAQIIYKAFF